MARIFGGNEIHLFQDAHRPERNVLQIANGCGYDIKVSV